MMADMALRNGPDSFGLVTRLVHWLMAALVIAMLALGLRLESMQPSLSNLWLYSLHKSLGLNVLMLVVLRLLWHRISPPPRPIGGGWQGMLARAVHAAIYLLLVAMPLSGWIASSATGLDILFFDRWVIPPIAPVSEAIEDRGFALHGAMGIALIALLGLHIAGALKHEMAGDGTLRRMIRGTARG